MQTIFFLADLTIDGVSAGPQNGCKNLNLPCIVQNAEFPPARMRAIATSAARPLNTEVLPRGRESCPRGRRFFAAVRLDARSLGETAGAGRMPRHPGKSLITCSFPRWRLYYFSRREFLPCTTPQNACRGGLAGISTARAECLLRRFLSVWHRRRLRLLFMRRTGHF